MSKKEQPALKKLFCASDGSPKESVKESLWNTHFEDYGRYVQFSTYLIGPFGPVWSLKIPSVRPVSPVSPSVTKVLILPTIGSLRFLA